MKPTTEHIITALRDGVALRTDLCERLGCENAALTKVIRNMLDRDLITRDMQDGALAYYLTPKGRAWQPGMQSASVRAKARQKAGDSEGGEADVVMHNPRTGTPRDERDIASDPAGILIVEPGKPLMAAQQAQSGYASNLTGAKSGLDKIFGIGKLEEELKNVTALADKLQHLLNTKTHECESLRAQMAHACDGGCKPDLETVPLPELIQHLALFLDGGVSLTIYGSDTASVQAFGKSFVCSYAEANGVLDSAAMLARLEVV